MFLQIYFYFQDKIEVLEVGTIQQQTFLETQPTNLKSKTGEINCKRNRLEPNTFQLRSHPQLKMCHFHRRLPRNPRFKPPKSIYPRFTFNCGKCIFIHEIELFIFRQMYYSIHNYRNFLCLNQRQRITQSTGMSFLFFIEIDIPRLLRYGKRFERAKPTNKECFFVQLQSCDQQISKLKTFR